MPPVLNTSASLGQLRKVVRLVGDPWADIETCERITIKIIASLAGNGYKLSMPINIDADTRVYFFIRDPEEQSDCIKVVTNYHCLRFKSYSRCLLCPSQATVTSPW